MNKVELEPKAMFHYIKIDLLRERGH